MHREEPKSYQDLLLADFLFPQSAIDKTDATTLPYKTQAFGRCSNYLSTCPLQVVINGPKPRGVRRCCG